MHDFADKDQDEEVVLTFDFSDQLGGDEIVSVVSVTCELLNGEDPYPEAMIVTPGGTFISSDLQAVQQKVMGGVNGNDYLFSAVVATASENLKLAGTMRVRKAT